MWQSRRPTNRRRSQQRRRPRREFQRGDTFTFDNRDGRGITGVVVRVNQRTATVGTGTGGTWQVPFNMLRHVLDI